MLTDIRRKYINKNYYENPSVLKFIELVQSKDATVLNNLCKYVSESDILGPIDNFSNIENLVSFESAMFADNSLKIKWGYSYFSCLYYHFELHA